LRTFCVSSLLVIAIAGTASAAELPAGNGRDALKRVCVQCHDLDVTVQLRNTRRGWTDVVQSMKVMGAEATDAELGQIVEYLTVNFGKIAGGGGEESPVKKDKPAVSRALPWEKNRMQTGQALYRENCVVCHDVDAAESKKMGPSFYHLFQREKMPFSAGKPGRSFIAGKIRAGGQNMPSFNKKLTSAEIDTLIDYMQSK